MFKGILSENIENIDKVTAQQIKKEQDKVKTQAENKPQDVQDLTSEIKEIQEEIDNLKSKLEQKKSARLKADYLSQVRIASCDIRRPKCHGQENHANF